MRRQSTYNLTNYVIRTKASCIHGCIKRLNYNSARQIFLPQSQSLLFFQCFFNRFCFTLNNIRKILFSLSPSKVIHFCFFYSCPFVSLFHLFRRVLDLSALCMLIILCKFLFIYVPFDTVLREPKYVSEDSFNDIHLRFIT